MGGLLATKNKYKVDEAAYNPAIQGSQDNNLALQGMLMDQAAGGGPNLGAQEFQNATQHLTQQAAGQIGAIKGISPAAQARLLQQQQASVGQGLAGEAAMQRMQQQLAAQQMLGQNSLGMFDVASGRKLGAQQINSGVAKDNAKAANDLTGGLINAAGGAGAAAMKGGKYDGGVIEPDDGPTSDLGRALMGMADGGVAGVVPGTPKVMADHPANDTVPTMLTPGEVVLPLSVTQHPDAPTAAASFVEALQRRQGTGQGFQRVVAARMACGGKV